jgi:hypothetical protein
VGLRASFHPGSSSSSLPTADPALKQFGEGTGRSVVQVGSQKRLGPSPIAPEKTGIAT